MKRFIALIREARNGELQEIRDNYKSKRKFEEDLKANGYKIVKIINSNDIKKVGNKHKAEHREEWEEYIEQVIIPEEKW